MDQMNQEEYEAVLRYMQTHNQQNFQAAYQALKEEQDEEQLEENLSDKNGLFFGEHPAQDRPPEPESELEREQFQKIKNHMLSHMEKRNNNRSIKASSSKLSKLKTSLIGSKFCQLTSKLCSRVTEKLLPEIIKRNIVRSVFYRMYQDQAVIQLKWSNVRLAVDSLRETRDRDNLDDFFRRINNDRMRGGRVNQNNMIGNDRIPQKQGIIVIVSDSSISHCLVEFLKKKKLLNAIGQNFEIVGLTLPEVERQLYLLPSVQIQQNGHFEFQQVDGCKPQKNYKTNKMMKLNETQIQSDEKQMEKHGEKEEEFFQFCSRESNMDKKVKTEAGQMGEKQQKVKSKGVNRISAPSILVIRQKQYKQLKIMRKYCDQLQILEQITMSSVIEWVDLIKEDEQIQKNMYKKVMDSLFYHANVHVFQEDPSLLRTIHEINRRRNILLQNHRFGENRPEVNNNLEAPFFQDNGVQVEDSDDQDRQQPQRYIANKRQSNLIRKQNEMYEKMQKQKQIQAKLLEEKQREKEYQLEERQVRKLSIPDEPTTDSENIVCINFRCPNGQSLSRNFLRDQKCEILFNWIQLNDQIQFEELENGEPNIFSRKFDLLHSYPPQSLIGKQDQNLDQVFEGASKVKLMIKQL